MGVGLKTSSCLNLYLYLNSFSPISSFSDITPVVSSCLLPGATQSVTRYFLQSQEAEARANASATDAGGAVETSAALRRQTEEKLNGSRDEFLTRHRERAQRLDDLAGEMQTLDLTEISHKVTAAVSAAAAASRRPRPTA